MPDAVSILWIAIGMSVAALIGARLWSRSQVPKDSMLGTVSDQWLAEQRLNRPDSQR
jgi:hypothetical protein